MGEFSGKIRQRVQLWDTTLRDGEQTPGVAFSQEEKIWIAHALNELGVHGISAGFPAVSSYEQDTVRRIASLGLRAQVMALSRVSREDVDAAASTGAPWISFFLPLSEWHMRDKLRADEETLAARVRDVLPYARSKGLKISFAAEDGTRTPFPRLLRFFRLAIESGAEYVRVCDTVGILTPTETIGLIQKLRPCIPVLLGVHFHNDLGMATANTLSAFEAGADGADVTVAGLGERAGNTPLEEIAVALRLKYDCSSELKLDQLATLAETAFRAAALTEPFNKPIVGRHVFSHESGIHVAGVLSNPITYEPFPPSWVGRFHKIIYGKHSGLIGVRHLLEKHQMTLSDLEEQQLLNRIKESGQNKTPPTEEQVLNWARELSIREHHV